MGCLSELRILEILYQLGQLEESQVEELASLHKPLVKNHRNDVVGGLEAVFKLPDVRT